MPNLRNFDEMLLAVKESLDAMGIDLSAFTNGKEAGYQDLAIQINKLLFANDGEPPYNGPLVVRVLPDLQLHPVHVEIEDDPHMLLDLPWPPFFTGHGTLYRLFDLTKPRIPIAQWGNQFVLGRKGYRFNIREVVKSVRNKDAAHLDPKIGGNYINLKEFTLYEFSQEVETTRDFKTLLFIIGTYVAGEVRAQLQERGL